MPHRICLLIVFCFTYLQCVYSQHIVLVKLDGAINPAAAAFIQRGLDKAVEENAECLILQLNTPGGLLKSTRVIVSSLLESKVPVIVFVAPGGAHAGSAGVFITMAANIAAMSPGTNIGAAHPVDLQGQKDSIMTEKATNDAAAFIRSIAEKRHRNLQWAEEAVRNSQSITESEALNMNVIDLIAKNLPDLLLQIDGKGIETIDGQRTLHTKEARIESVTMGWEERLLDVLSDPNIAYILFMLGMYGLMFELYNPGSIFPGIVGVISMILAFYSMHTLPINYAGLALIIFGVILFLLEIKIVSNGMLGIGGIISLFLGSIMLIRTESMLEVVEISWSVIVGSVAFSAVFFLFLIGLGLKSMKSKPTTGIEGLTGETGRVLTNLNPEGTVQIHGEIWNAISSSGIISTGTLVRVIGIENLSLKVEQVKQ
jgi:membrane-bound serine protease (ClpP class)